jgi:hypothetical protein
MKVTSKSIHFNYKEQCEFNYKLNIKNYPEYKKLRKIARAFPHLFEKCLFAHPQVKYEKEGYDAYEFFPKPWVEDLPGEEFRVFKHPDFPGIPLFSVSNKGRGVTHNIKAGGRSCIGVKFNKEKGEKRKIIKSIGDTYDINTRQIIKMSRSLHKHSGKPKCIHLMTRLPDGRAFNISLHKVLMDLFKPIEDNIPDVWAGMKFTKEQLDELRDLYLINHIDHNPFNNNLDNLERVTIIRNFEAAREHYAKDN